MKLSLGSDLYDGITDKGNRFALVIIDKNFTFWSVKSENNELKGVDTAHQKM